MDPKKILSLVPILGAAFRKDESKSEYDVAASAIGAVIALPDIPPLWKAIVVGGVAVVYIVSRTMKKNAEAAHA